MNITVPKQRNVNKWKQSEEQLKNFMKKVEKSTFNLKEYCEFSLIFIEAIDEVFLDERYKEQIKKLQSNQIDFKNSVRQSNNMETTKQEQTRAQGIIGVFNNAWRIIIDLIKGKRENKNSPLGIYTDENINIHFARLEEMLRELEGKNYRISAFMKQNAFIREMQQKEINEELIFVKLLQSIIHNQTNRIRNARKQQGNVHPEEPQQNQPQEEEIEIQKPLDVKEVVKVQAYFQRKMESMNQPSHPILDPIDKQREKRKFNAAAVRFHMHYNQIRR